MKLNDKLLSGKIKISSHYLVSQFTEMHKRQKNATRDVVNGCIMYCGYNKYYTQPIVRA